MRLVGISVVKNEIDIVEPFVRHAAARLDRLLVLDNGSTDGTRQILRRLVDEGLPVEVLDDPEPGNYQWRRMTGLMRDHAIKRCGADWVVPLDADEFLVGEDLKLLVRSVENRPCALHWRTYVPGPDDVAGELNPVRRITDRLRQEARPWLKVMVPASLGRHPTAMLDQGSHQFIHEGLPIPPVEGRSGALAHFPGRDPDQFACKVAMKHLQYLAMTERAGSWGFHYRAPAAQLRQGRRYFDDNFRETILRYNLRPDEPFVPELVRDPAPYSGGDLRYTPALTESRLLATLWDAAEDLARRHAELTRGQLAAEAALRRQDEALVATQRKWASDVAQLTAELREAETWRRSWTCRAGRLAKAAVRWVRRRLPSRAGSH